MKNLLKKLSKILLVLSISAVFIFETPSFADVGGIQRYSSGSSSSSSSSSRRSSSSSSRSSSSSSSSSGSALSGVEAFIFLIVIVAIIIYSRKHGKLPNSFTDGLSHLANTADNTESVANQIRQIDPAFSEDNFLSWTKEVFIKLQNAWTKKDWSIIRPFESNELFEQHNSQLQDFINAGKTNIVERISVTSATLYSFAQDGDKETLKVTLKAVMRDYIIEDETKKVLEGDPNIDQYMTYRLTFIRKTGVKTKEGTDEKSTTNCPNCGAPTSITSAGQCEYCGSVITTGEHGWVLSNLEGV